MKFLFKSLWSTSPPWSHGSTLARRPKRARCERDTSEALLFTVLPCVDDEAELPLVLLGGDEMENTAVWSGVSHLGSCWQEGHRLYIFVSLAFFPPTRTMKDTWEHKWDHKWDHKWEQKWDHKWDHKWEHMGDHIGTRGFA